VESIWKNRSEPGRRHCGWIEVIAVTDSVTTRLRPKSQRQLDKSMYDTILHDNNLLIIPILALPCPIFGAVLCLCESTAGGSGHVRCVKGLNLPGMYSSSSSVKRPHNACNICFFFFCCSKLGRGVPRVTPICISRRPSRLLNNEPEPAIRPRRVDL